ncbi:TPA: hypothetical protein ACU8BT_002150, partial [Neisseria subflava]
AVTGVRFPVGVPVFKKTQSVSDCVFLLYLLCMFYGRLKRSANPEAEACKINCSGFCCLYALFNLILPLSKPNLLTTVFILKIPKPEFT